MKKFAFALMFVVLFAGTAFAQRGGRGGGGGRMGGGGIGGGGIGRGSAGFSSGGVGGGISRGGAGFLGGRVGGFNRGVYGINTFGLNRGYNRGYYGGYGGYGYGGYGYGGYGGYGYGYDPYYYNAYPDYDSNSSYGNSGGYYHGRLLGIDEEAFVDSCGRKGMKITKVYPGMASERAGLEIGDILISANEYLTVQSGNLAWIIQTVTPTDELRLNVRKLKDGQEHLVVAKLESANQGR